MPDKPRIEHITMPDRKPSDNLRDLLMRQLRAPGGDPSQLLDLIELAVKNRLWEEGGFSFAEFIALPYVQGGLGWSVDNLRGIMRLEHRYEATNGEIKTRMDKLRREVDCLLVVTAQKVGRPEKVVRKNGRVPTISNTSQGKDRSRDYQLARLQRDRPDLAKEVLSGKISAHKASITAGFQKRTAKVYPDDLDYTIAALKRHFDAEALNIIAETILSKGD